MKLNIYFIHIYSRNYESLKTFVHIPKINKTSKYEIYF